jgi:phosphate-selective porin
MTTPWLLSALAVLLAATPVVAQENSGDSSTDSAARSDAQVEGGKGGWKEGWKVAWEDHPAVEWSGKLRVEFRARVHLDQRGSQAAIANEDDTRDVARRQVGVAGLVGRNVEFTVNGDINTVDAWRDVFVNYRRWSAVQVQAGRFTLPFGLEETTADDALDLEYRSLASNRLAPGRDVGVMLRGRVARRIVGYEIGVFANDGDNARLDGASRVSGGETLAGRVVIAPFARSTSDLSDLELGVAFTRSELPNGFPAVRGRSVLGVSFFDADQWVNGVRRRAGAQVRWRPNRVSMAAEYMRLSDDRGNPGTPGASLAPLIANGWSVSGALRQPLFGGAHGSLVLAARIERLAFSSAAGPGDPAFGSDVGMVIGSADSAETIGATWHLNRWLAIEAAVIHELITSDVNRSQPLMRAWSHVLRFQMEM